MQLFMMSLGLLFIFEGLLPFLLPDVWRNAMQNIIQQDNKTLRLFGFISLLIGLGWLYLNR